MSAIGIEEEKKEKHKDKEKKEEKPDIDKYFVFGIEIMGIKRS